MVNGDGASDAGLLFDLGRALKKAEPKAPLKGRWHHFDAMSPHERPWNLERIRQEGEVQGDRVLALWQALVGDVDEPQLDADASRESKTPKDSPNPY